MIKAVLFDLWDTLAYMPGIKAVMDAEKKLFGESGYEKVRKIFRQAHREFVSMDDFIARMKNEIPLTAADEAFVRSFYEVETYQLFPDVLETLEWIRTRGCLMGLVSNCPSPTGKQLDHLGIRPYFNSVILSFEVRLMKPEKEIFEMALEQLGVDASQALMVGDKVSQDMAGAQSAGVRGILLDRDDAHEFQEKIKSLLELKNIV